MYVYVNGRFFWNLWKMHLPIDTWPAEPDDLLESHPIWSILWFIIVEMNLPLNTSAAELIQPE